MTFNYGGKNATDKALLVDILGHLSNVIPNSIFYDCTGWRITCFFCKGDNHSLPQHKRDGFSCVVYYCYGPEKALSFNGQR